MTDLVKAARAIVPLGLIEVEGFMLPDDSYRMSLSQGGQCVGKAAQGVSNFLQSKALKSLLGEPGGISNFLPAPTLQSLSTTGYIPDQFVVDLAGGNQGQTRIRGIHLEVVTLYWQWESFRGNKQAFILVTGLSLEALERRFDAAFGIRRSESEYDRRLAQRTRELERDLSRLGEAYAMDDDLRHRVDYLEKFCREHGLDPWGVNGQIDQ
jgi:hypothetical protein